jgi:hypothetical protein
MYTYASSVYTTTNSISSTYRASTTSSSGKQVDAAKPEQHADCNVASNSEALVRESVAHDWR